MTAKNWNAPVMQETRLYLTGLEQFQHIRDFRKAPMHMRKAWCRAEIEAIDAVEFFDHPMSYQRAMDRRRKLAAALVDMTDREYDPVGYWFGGMSN